MEDFQWFYTQVGPKTNDMGRQIDSFCGYLVDRNSKSTTINSYISAIKSVLRDIDIIIQEDCYLLSALTRACRLKNDVLQTRLPIKKGMLRILLKEIANYFLSCESNQVYLANLYMTIFATAYYGMFRISELTSGTHPVRACDVHLAVNKKKFLFVLLTSKTHGKGNKLQKIRISENPTRMGNLTNTWYPYELLTNYSSN